MMTRMRARTKTRLWAGLIAGAIAVGICLAGLGCKRSGGANAGPTDEEKAIAKQQKMKMEEKFRGITGKTPGQ